MRKGSGTVLSDKIKYLGVFCRQSAGCSFFPADGGGGASGDPTNLESRLGEIFHRDLSVARGLVSLATGAKE